MRKKLTLSIASSLLIWIFGFCYYMYYTRSYNIDYSVTTDAIAVFTGGSERINTGIKLLKAGYAPILFISGVSSPTQLKNFLNERGVQQDQVFYGLDANDTKDNAAEIAEFTAAHGLKSIRLVTSSYHMPRALEETKQLLPIGIVVIPNPVISIYKNYITTFKEYNKYLISKTFQFMK